MNRGSFDGDFLILSLMGVLNDWKAPSLELSCLETESKTIFRQNERSPRRILSFQIQVDFLMRLAKLPAEWAPRGSR